MQQKVETLVVLKQYKKNLRNNIIEGEILELDNCNNFIN